MALIDVADVVQGVATLLDDPSQSSIDADYVIPFINLKWSNIVVNLAMLGLQYGEQVAIFDLPAGTVSLANWMASGQPLASLMQPKSIDWKPQGAPDTEFDPSDRVAELDDVDPSSIGVLQYSWQGGTVQVMPSAEPVTVRVRFQSMSTTLVDPTDEMIRGVGDVLAFRVASLIYGIRGNKDLRLQMQQDGDVALDDFIAMSVMNSQANLTRIPATHPRRFVRGIVIRAGN